MQDEIVSVIDIARLYGKHKQSVFKLVRRLGIEMVKVQGEDSRGQKISCITMKDYEILKPELEQMGNADDQHDTLESSYGVFYLIQLEPDLDPGRFKVGFAVNVDQRLRSHRISAPLCILVRTWPCKALWEKTAIDSICAGYERLYTEVFRADSIEEVVDRYEEFFSVMPTNA
jgi:hypothetical protein